MSMLAWSTSRNLENSYRKYLEDQIASESLEVLDQNGALVTPQVRVGFKREDDWVLPLIAVYVDPSTHEKAFIGSTKTIDTYLLITDIRALDSGMQKDLSDWAIGKIEDGFDFYSFSPNSSTPDSPNKTKTGKVSTTILTNTPVRFGDNTDIFDRWRQNVTFNAQIVNTS